MERFGLVLCAGLTMSVLFTGCGAPEEEYLDDLQTIGAIDPDQVQAPAAPGSVHKCTAIDPVTGDVAGILLDCHSSKRIPEKR